MQENHRSSLRYQLALQKEKVLHENNSFEKLLLEYSEHLNLSFIAAVAVAATTTSSGRTRQLCIPPNIDENHNCDPICYFCGGFITAVTNVMGLENFLKKIRALFTNTNGEDKNEITRKRRNSNVLPHQRKPLKYRRVDNNFPKFLPMSHQVDEQDDDDCVVNGAAYNLINSHSSHPQSAATTTSGLTNGPVKYNLQRSIFDAPQTTRKVIQCMNVTDITLSDEDDDLYLNFVRQEMNRNNGIRGNRKSLKPLELICDLTSAKTNWTTTTTTNLAHDLPPPMRKLSARTSTSVVHNSEYLICSSSVSSREAPSAESTLTLVNSFWPSIPHRAGTQEREVFDHGEYLRLLQKNMPRVYCSNGEIKEKQHIIKHTKQRLSAECEIVQQPFSSTTINIDGAYDKQEIHKFVIDDDDDIVEINKRHSTTTLSESRLRSNINVREQSASLHFMRKSKSNHQIQHSVVESVDLTDDDDGIVEKILIMNGLDKFVDVNDDDDDDDDDLVIVKNGATDTNSDSVSLDLRASPVNTLSDRLRQCEFLNQNWTGNFEHKWDKINNTHKNESQLIESQLGEISNARENYIRDVLSNRLERQISLHEKPSLFVEVITDKSKDADEIIMPLNEDHIRILHSFFKVPDNKVLVCKFGLSITRHDINSLCDTNWLNDEVINFYMNLLTERSEQRSDLPAVYAMNTFFVQRLMNGGYAAVKRWTRKVNLFAKDIIPVPVHVGGVHWCMAIIHLKQKTIRYYDSMGQPNNNVLNALEAYLHEESLDKLKQDFDTRCFKIESVSNSPRQTNGSDCGVFSCMTAEYITRGRPITFTQANMNYFRQKMILEIVGGHLWQ